MSRRKSQQRKKLPLLTIVCIAATVLLLMVTGAFWLYHAANNKAVTHSEQSTLPTHMQNSDKAGQRPTATTQPSSEPSPEQTKGGGTKPATANPRSSPQKPRPSPAPAVPEYVPLEPPRFTAGRISTSIPCFGTTYAYILSSVSINANRLGAGVFSWRIELGDGTVYQQGTSSMYDTTVLPAFPSTPGFPSDLGWIDQPTDGLTARFVITSPNYSAGSWSNPVPAGSGSSCHASHTYNP